MSQKPMPTKSGSGDTLADEVLTTDRLTIRKAARADHGAVVALWSDASFKMMLPHKERDGLPPDPGYLASAASSIIKSGNLFVVFDGAGDLVGTVNRFGKDPAHPAIGWYVAPSRRGEGLASEAVTRVVEHLLDSRAAAIQVGMFDDNAASQRIAEKLGFQPVPGPAGHLQFKTTRAIWDDRPAPSGPGPR